MPSDTVIELRQYTLHEGQRDAFIHLFESALLEPQEAAGIRVLGQFRDVDRADRVVWLRSFPDMETRERVLTAFYSGPVWKARRDETNATLVDSDNVLLLRPARPEAADGLRAPGSGDRTRLAVANAYSLTSPPDDALLHSLEAAVAACGIPVLAWLKTEPSPNTYPRLPVREGEHTLAWLSGFLPRAEQEERWARLHASPQWAEGVARRLRRPAEVLRLLPSSASRLHA